MADGKQSSTLRNAAIFIRSLDTDLAAQLLARLTPKEAHTLRMAMRDLGHFDDGDLVSVTVALRNSQGASEATISEEVGVELHSDEKKSAVDQHVDKISLKPERIMISPLAKREQLACPQPRPTRFQSLLETDSEALAAFLKCEHPQTIAVVFSYLPPSKAAEALAALPDACQADVVHRLSYLQDADSATLEVVERSLESWLSEQRREQQRHVDRMSIIRSILGASQDRTRQTIFAKLRQRDQPLADQIESQFSRSKKSLYRRDIRSPQTASCTMQSCTEQTDIEILMNLSGPQVRTFVNQVDPQVLHCALTAASECLLDRMSKCLTREEWKDIQRGISSLGPISLRDVEAAQRIVAECVTRIEATNFRGNLIGAA